MKRILLITCIAFVLPLSGCNESTESTTEFQQPNATNSTSNPEATAASKEIVPNDSENNIIFGDKFPEVLAVTADHVEYNNWRFKVTLSSTYDSPQRYADAWRVLDAQDNELGIRVLGHDHANEQPFTRSGSIKLPEDTSTVYVEGRDQENGWSGQRFQFELPEN